MGTVPLEWSDRLELSSVCRLPLLDRRRRKSLKKGILNLESLSVGTVRLGGADSGRIYPVGPKHVAGCVVCRIGQCLGYDVNGQKDRKHSRMRAVG